MIEILTEKEVYVDEQLVERLKFLTYSGEGKSGCFINDLRSMRNGYYFLAKEKNIVIGWLLLCKRLNGTTWQIGTYVSVKNRNNGIGTKLVKEAKKFAAQNNLEIYCVPTPIGERLYKKFDIPTSLVWHRLE